MVGALRQLKEGYARDKSFCDPDRSQPIQHAVLNELNESRVGLLCDGLCTVHPEPLERFGEFRKGYPTMCKRGLELILSLCEEALRALRPGESEVRVSGPAFGFTICVAT